MAPCSEDNLALFDLLIEEYINISTLNSKKHKFISSEVIITQI